LASATDFTSAGASLPPSEVQVWDPDTGEKLLALKVHTGAVWSVAINIDGKRIASAAIDPRSGWLAEVKWWSAGASHVPLVLKVRTRKVSHVAISADGKRILSAADAVLVPEGSPHEIKLWDAGTGRQLRAVKEETDDLLSIDLSADGQRIVSSAYVKGIY